MKTVTFGILAVLGYSVVVNGSDFTAPLLHNSDEYNSYINHNYHTAYLHEDNHPCRRRCIVGQSQTCYYEFIIHYYEAASEVCLATGNNPFQGCIEADGVQTGLLAVNRQIAGPAIEVCENDTIVVDVINELREATTIHWHGIHMKQTPEMDGAQFTTQYPINAGESMRYKFTVAPQHGTFWWHSHMNMQRAFGVAGPLIIRRDDEVNPHAHLYDYDLSDHTVFLQDWFYNYSSNTPRNILVNAKGHSNLTDVKHGGFPLNHERFKVIQGNRYRFRVIYNGNANCPLELSIDKHEMLIINSDGNDIEPVNVKSLVIQTAERYDFVFHAYEEINNYWLRVKGHGFCASGRISQAAIIQYIGAPTYSLPRAALSYDYEERGLQLNPIDVGRSTNAHQLTVVELNSIKYSDWPANIPFKTFYTSMGLKRVPSADFFGFLMDDIYFEMPSISLLQARYLDIEPFFCNKTSLLNEGKVCKNPNEICKCTNVIQIPAYEYIEFVLTSETQTGHPFHPHGIDFRVVGMGILGETYVKEVKEIDRVNPLPRRLDRSSPIKDTIQVPGFGYTIIRFYSDNPGFWMFHCHLSIHSDNGMMSILKIGENDQMLPTPNNNCLRNPHTHPHSLVRK